MNDIIKNIEAEQMKEKKKKCICIRDKNGGGAGFFRKFC